MAKETTVQGSAGAVPCTFLGEVQVEGKTYCIIKMGVGGCIKGVFSKYQLVSPSLINEKIPDLVEVVNDSEEKTRRKIT